MPGVLWLRAETKPREARTPLTPLGVAQLAESGVRVMVERSNERCFDDASYAEHGAVLVPTGSWVDAPAHALVLGLKELPDDPPALRHAHAFFGHAFKGQAAGRALLERFARGGGLLLDLEFLVDDRGRRVAAFGRWAGFVGAAVAVEAWAHAQLGMPMERVVPARHAAALVQRTAKALTLGVTKAGRLPRALVTGAQGRSGRGARALLNAVGVAHDGWDVAETAQGGPFEAILAYDLLVHCVALSAPEPPFVSREHLDRPRTLSVICDVTCDLTSPQNVLPLSSCSTSLDQPTLRLIEGAPPLDWIGIDHLPTVLPRESSEDFAGQLLPHLSAYFAGGPSAVWSRAQSLFDRHVAARTVQP